MHQLRSLEWDLYAGVQVVPAATGAAQFCGKSERCICRWRHCIIMNAGSGHAFGSSPRHTRIDGILRALARFTLGTFYRRIEVVGLDLFPKTGPVIVVANHYNSLVDGAIITGFLPRMPRFLGASTLWDYGPLRPILNAAGVVPLFRRQDGRGDRAALATSFSKATELLCSGGVLAVFPEGLSHNRPSILPFKTGTARIALEAEEQLEAQSVQIVPVALTFEEKNKFRSSTLIEIGQPIVVDQEQGDSVNPTDQAKTSAQVKALTGRIQTSLEALKPGFDTWEDARLLGRAAEMLATPDPFRSNEGALAEDMSLRRALRQGYSTVHNDHPDKTDQLRKDLKEYDRMLRIAGLSDHQIGRAEPAGLIAGVVAKAVFFFVIRLPVSAIGFALNWPVYRLLLALSRNRELDKRSTWSIFGGLFVFPLYWVVVALVAGYFSARQWDVQTGWIVGLGVIILAPISGKVLLSARDLFLETLGAIRAWSKLRTPNRFNKALLQKRKSVLDQIEALVAEYQKHHGTELN